MKYYTFPVSFLKDGPCMLKNCLDNAMDYCLYQEASKNQISIKDAAKNLGIRFCNLNESNTNGRTLAGIHDSGAKTSISNEMLFDFYKSDKTEFESVCFIAFAAVRSIIQKQAYTKITNEYLLARMGGNSKKGDTLPDWLKNYQSRYKLDKIKTELQLNWGLKLYGNHTRGFYVSFSMDLTTLIKEAEKRRKNRREKQLRLEKAKALQMALKEIGT